MCRRGFPKACAGSSGDFRVPGGVALMHGRIYRGSCAEDSTGVESTGEEFGSDY